MTKKELSINIKWDEFEMGTCRIFVETLNQYIPTVFFQDHKPKPIVTNKMLQSVNDILDMDIKEFERLEEILGTEDYRDSKIKEIHIDQDNGVFEGIYSEVIVAVSGNRQISVIVKDGKFMFVNDGTYFDTLAIPEVKAESNSLSKEKREKEIREKILAIMSSS